MRGGAAEKAEQDSALMKKRPGQQSIALMARFQSSFLQQAMGPEVKGVQKTSVLIPFPVSIALRVRFSTFFLPSPSNSNSCQARACFLTLREHMHCEKVPRLLLAPAAVITSTPQLMQNGCF